MNIGNKKGNEIGKDRSWTGVMTLLMLLVPFQTLLRNAIIWSDALM